jgi:heme/copper-type cytochrome/quinol oxidase subunit 3
LASEVVERRSVRCRRPLGGLLFAALFAVYSVLGREFASGPTAKDLFDLPYVLAETLCPLLTSSFTYGMVMVALNAGNRARVLGFLLLTFLLGLCFIGLEVKEFIRMVGEGAVCRRHYLLGICGTARSLSEESGGGGSQPKTERPP